MTEPRTTPTDSKRLHTLLCAAIMNRVQPQRGTDLPGLCDALALPPADHVGSKREYVQARLDPLEGDAALIETVARRFAEVYPLSPENEATYGIQEVLWSGIGPTVSKRARRELGAALDAAPLYIEWKGFLGALESLFVLESAGDVFSRAMGMPSGLKSLRGQLEQWTHKNDDWSCSDVFREIGALDCSSHRFSKLVEALAGPDVRPDESEQRLFVQRARSVLTQHGLDIREGDQRDGYPTFVMCGVGRPASRPIGSDSGSEKHVPQPDGQLERLVEDVERATTNDDKGRSLERLMARLFASIPGFSVAGTNTGTETEEIDLTILNDSSDPRFKREEALLIVECKNWSSKCGKNEFVIFKEKVENRSQRSSLGFLVSWNGFAVTVTKEMLRGSRERTLIVPITGEQVRRAVRRHSFPEELHAAWQAAVQT